MAELKEIVSLLNEELRIAELPDYPGALNGLQLENGGEVSKVAAAVDASLAVVKGAVAEGADLLLVHHGLFWQGARPLTGALYEKIKIAMDHGLAIYSAHIPLDVHPRLGNNILLAQALGMTEAEPFFNWKGIELGLMREMDLSLEELARRVEEAVGGAVLSCGRQEGAAGRVGLITGGAGNEVEAMAACGVETFISGEGPHWSAPLAEDLGLAVIYGGHYATETFGVRALADFLVNKKGLETFFIDRPTGL